MSKWTITAPDGRTWSADERMHALSACMRDTRTPESDARLLESIRKDREEAEAGVAEVLRLADEDLHLKSRWAEFEAAVRKLAGLE